MLRAAHSAPSTFIAELKRSAKIMNEFFSLLRAMLFAVFAMLIGSAKPLGQCQGGWMLMSAMVLALYGLLAGFIGYTFISLLIALVRKNNEETKAFRQRWSTVCAVTAAFSWGLYYTLRT